MRRSIGRWRSFGPSCRKCVNEWEWLDRAPQVRMLKEPTRRVRFLSREEAQRLLAELPEHLADMAAFSLATGLRRSNVTGLQWSQVDLARRLAWIHPDQAKARKAIPVPLNAEAVALIRASSSGSTRRTCSAIGASRSSRSTRRPGTRRSERAGIEDFRWHDLRHTWASWHVQKGTPLYRAAGVGRLGESRRWCGVMRTFSAEHLAPYADRLCALRAVEEKSNGTFLSHP